VLLLALRGGAAELPGEETPPLEWALLGKPPVPGVWKAFVAQ